MIDLKVFNLQEQGDPEVFWSSTSVVLRILTKRLVVKKKSQTIR